MGALLCSLVLGVQWGGKQPLCVREQARASGFAAERLSLGLLLYLWLLSLQLSVVLATAQTPVCGQWLSGFPLPGRQGKLSFSF